MSFFHCVTAFTSFESIPVSDSVSHILSWWFEKLQVPKDLQLCQVSYSIFCEPLKSSRSYIVFVRYKLKVEWCKSFLFHASFGHCNLAAPTAEIKWGTLFISDSEFKARDLDINWHLDDQKSNSSKEQIY